MTTDNSATRSQPTRLILTDIEGTTSSISFVKEVLFPYASAHLADYVIQHQDQLQDLLQDIVTASDKLDDRQDIDGIIQQLQHWIAADIKATPLKTLQGLIWQQGYQDGAYQAHMYEDAVTKLKDWSQQNIPLYVYSSGSVKAQHLFFQYSDQGDLRGLFKGHFDTRVGAKQNPDSYRRITAQLQQTYPDLQPIEIMFLSDIEAELVAAETAGLRTAWLRRKEDCDADHNSSRPYLSSFDSIEIMAVKST